ncbi:MAG: CoA transferase, partial [Chloroflexi bacterium]|nr:CoA transferase [Chloroflexota bacterium]
PEWAEDARFADGYRRLQNRRLLDELVSQWTSQRTAYEAMEILQHAGVAAAPSLKKAELFDDPHLRAREFFVAPEQPETGTRPMPGLPWRATGNPGGLDPEYRPAPLLGEHTEYVLRDLLGYLDEEIVDLVASGVIN